MEINLMTKITEHAERQNARLDQIDAAIGGITEDLRVMNEMIENLQNNPGPISAEDQATLDALEARGTALAERLVALDASNPKPPTPTP